MSVSKRNFNRSKVGEVLVWSVAASSCFFSITALLTEFNDFAFQDAPWLLITGFVLVYGALGFYWCYFYDDKSLMSEIQVCSANSDAGFMFVYCCFPVLLMLIGLSYVMWNENFFSEAWLELIVEVSDFDMQVFGFFVFSLFTLGLGAVTMLFLGMVLKGMLLLVQNRKFGPTILTLNQPNFIEGEHVVARFHTLKQMTNPIGATLQCTHSFCPPSSRKMRFKFLYSEPVSIEVTDHDMGSMVEMKFDVPQRVIPNLEQYDLYLVSEFKWALRVESKLAHSHEKLLSWTRTWLLDISGEPGLVGL